MNYVHNENGVSDTSKSDSQIPAFQDFFILDLH